MMFLENIDRFFVPESGLPVNGPIYLAKEDNVTTEQTFLVNVQVSDSVPPRQDIHPATLDVDYRLSVAVGTSAELQFGPRDQRIMFPLTLFSDNLPEGTEAFLVSSAPGDNVILPDGTIFPVSTFQNPNAALFAETFVVIEDNDRKFSIAIGYCIYQLTEE